MDKKDLMREVIRKAEENIYQGNGGPFGAAVVKDGEVIAFGMNSVISRNDPTAHAEVVAIREAGSKLRNFDLSGCELYTSCEPCPMCLAAAYWARIDKIYYANTQHDAANTGFDDKWIYDELSKEHSEREIYMEFISVETASKPFKAWKVLENKIEY